MTNTSRRILVVVALFLSSGLAPSHAQDRLAPFNRPARSVRTRAYDTKHVRLDLDIDWQTQQIRGRATHTLVPFAPLSQLVMDAAEMTIERVVERPKGGSAITREFDTRGDKLTIQLGRRVAAGETLRLAIDYVVTRPRRGAHFVLADDRDPQKRNIIWTQSEPEYARYWLPGFDSPNERLTSEILATVPEGFFVLSNGTLVDKQPSGDGRVTWHYAQRRTHVPYLMSVVAGEFEAYEQQWDGIPVISYVPPGRLDEAARSFAKTPGMVGFFSEKIGYRYPWPKYTQICCDEYGGGMEHTSATTLTLRTLHDARAHLDVSSDSLVAHELAHQWWGDLITCKDWAEIWLNESFATYFASLWTEEDLGWDEAVWERRGQAESYFSEDRRRYRRPIVTYRYPDPGRMFDRHSYPKGSRVLHMLRFVLGDDMFWSAIRHYAQKHAFGVVETADLRVAVEEATGRGLNWFFDQWLHHGGHPEYRVSYEWNAEQHDLALSVRQTQKVDELTPLFRMPVEIDIVDADNHALTRTITVAKAEETFHFHLDARPRRVVFDPRDWILKKVTIEKSKQEWLDQLEFDPHLMARIRAADALKAFTSDTDARRALAHSAREDRFWAVRERAVTALADFGADGVREVLILAAGDDEKAAVRRAAVKTLANFPHADTNRLLRTVIRDDPSYSTVADALGTLVKVDADHARDDLLAALERTSHQEVILKASCDGLAELGRPEDRRRVAALLDGPSSPQRRVAAFSALAKLADGDREVTQLLAEELDDPRRRVRQAAIVALGETGDLSAIDVLREARQRFNRTSTLGSIDDAMEKLGKSTDLDDVKQEIDALKRANRRLEGRLRKLQEADSP